MKKLVLLVLLSAFACSPCFPRGDKAITLEDVWQKGTFTVKNVPGFNALKDGRHYTQTDVSGDVIQINMYRLADGKKIRTIYDNSRQPSGEHSVKVDDYSFSADEQKMLLLAESENIYRRSVLHKVYVYDLNTKAVSLLDEEKVLHATFNHSGDKVAFVKHNNLYYKDLLTGKVTAVTTDGARNRIINGNCDWVYEEEFEFTRAYQWSPDGRYLAYYRFDESEVKEYTMALYDSLYPTQYTYKYPKAGERNSVVSIRLYDLNSGKTIPADIGGETDQYIPRIKWAAKDKLCIYRMNRLQNKLEYLLADAATGRSRVIMTEDNRYYIEINDNLTFLPDGESFIFSSERSGYNHLYKWNWERQELTQLTKGDWNVDVMHGADPVTRRVYYTAGVSSPLQRKFYRVDWDGRNNVCLTAQDGWHDIIPCEGYNYFLDRYSALNKVPVFTLIDSEGKKVRILEDNKELEEKLEQYNLGELKILTVPGNGGDQLNAWMITPPDFDPARKYPLLMYQYSGPNSQEVKERFPLGNYFWHQMMAQKGYIIVCADGTGTGGRSEEFKKKTYLQLGNLESNDQIAVARYLAKQPYTDADRIGIWGWSFGGFMSATCILKGNDVFKTAVSVAPVTNWRLYDNIYTERYMRTPQENPDGYDNNAPEKMADKLKGNLLIVHGTADDNVHFQNAVIFTDALIKANKQFDTEYYPNKNHGISGGITRLQLFRRITDYLLRNL